jgi:hypothetical protein
MLFDVEMSSEKRPSPRTRCGLESDAPRLVAVTAVFMALACGGQTTPVDLRGSRLALT